MQQDLSNLEQGSSVNIWSLFAQFLPAMPQEEYARLSKQDEKTVKGQVAHRNIPSVAFSDAKGAKRYVNIAAMFVQSLEQAGYKVEGVTKA